MRRAAGLMVVGLALACGMTRTNSVSPIGDAGASTDGAMPGHGGEGSSDAGASPALGGAAPSGGATTAAAGTNSASTAGSAPDSIIDTGTRYCLDVRECFGLSCLGMAGADKTVCLVPCSEGGVCGAEERCLDQDGIMPGCFAQCELVTDCAYQFDCYDLNRDGERVCLPTEWALLLGAR